jgi:hypothetical protein
MRSEQQKSSRNPVVQAGSLSRKQLRRKGRWLKCRDLFGLHFFSAYFGLHIDSIHVEGMEPSHGNITKMGYGIDKPRLRHIFACRFIFHFKYK